MMEAVKRRKEAPPVCEDEKLLIDTILESGFDDEQARQDWAVFLISGFHASGLRKYCLQYRHLIPAPFDRTSASAWLYTHPWVTYQK